jgi:arsenate reductase-like glutaredoxin family protein
MRGANDETCHDLRHQELRHHEEGTRLARRPRRELRIPRLKAWCDELGWETLLNRAGTTFRKLPEADKAGLNERKALALMLEQPSMIKRPVLEAGGKLLVGFKPEIYASELKASAGARRAKA